MKKLNFFYNYTRFYKEKELYMKSIECIDCEVIQDLLPSYCDGVTSELSNKLVEGHLKKCKNCKNILEEMNKQISLNYEKKQEERISFLKKYNKNMVKAILITIAVILLIINILIDVFYVILPKCDFFVDINDISVYANYVRYSDDGKISEVNFSIKHDKYILTCDEYEEFDESGNLILHCVFKGKFPFGKGVPTAHGFGLFKGNDDDKLKSIIFEDTKGNKREVWNKDEGIKVEGRIFWE